MISEDMLHSAACRASEIYVSHLEAGYDPEHPHEFTPEFEKKIRRLERKANHPFFYQTLRRVASIVLAILIAGGTWFTVDAEAKTAFIGWVKEIYESYFVYHFDGGAEDNADQADYRPTYLPEGYEEFYADKTSGTTTVAYANEEGYIIQLCYARNSSEADWFIQSDKIESRDTLVHGNRAEFLLSRDPAVSNAILWTNEDNTSFYLAAFLGEEDLIKVAESIQIKS